MTEIERIRDIITGPVVAQSTQQYAALAATVEALRAEMSHQMDELRQQSAAADEALRAEVRRLADQLGHDKLDRSMLSDQFIKLGEQLRAAGR